MRGHLVSEQSCAEPDDLYGMMHLARETMIKSATKAPVAILRTTLVYGAADTHNSYGPNRFRRMAHKDGKITLFGQGEETRDHILVNDVAALAGRSLRHRSAGTLNLATGRSISYAELAKKVAHYSISRSRYRYLKTNPDLASAFDVTALRKAFPTFVFTPLEQGLAKAHREMPEQG